MSEKKRKAKWQNDYIARAYDRINLTVPRGRKDEIKAHAGSFDGGSVTAFINRAIVETIVRDERRRDKIMRETREQNPDIDDVMLAAIVAERESLQRMTQERMEALHMMKRKRARNAEMEDDAPEPPES